MNAPAELLKSLRIDRNAPPPTSRGALWIGLAVAAAVLLALAGWWLLARGRAIEVRTTEVVAIGSGGGNASVLDASGYVVARRMATVSAKVPGRVREVLIEEGQRVEAGQVIATLDPIDAEQQRLLSASQLQAARSQSAGVQAQLKEAEANAARLGALAAERLVSRAQYEQAIAQRDSLRAQLASARRNAQVASDALRIAAQGVDNTIVRAPFAGVVIAKAAQPGEIISPMAAGGGFTRTGIGTIVDMESLEVEVEVGEAFIGRVKPGMPVEAVLNAYQDWRIPAAVIAIIPTADRGKATVKVRVALREKDPRIVPEMGVRVSFLDAARPVQPQARPGVLLPAAAITQRQGKDVAFVVQGERAAQRSVVLGRTLGDDREVLEGLSGGEVAILDPPGALQDGTRVRAADDEADDD